MDIVKAGVIALVVMGLLFLAAIAVIKGEQRVDGDLKPRTYGQAYIPNCKPIVCGNTGCKGDNGLLKELDQ